MSDELMRAIEAEYEAEFEAEFQAGYKPKPRPRPKRATEFAVFDRIASLERQLERARQEIKELKTMISVYQTNSHRLLTERSELQKIVENFQK